MRVCRVYVHRWCAFAASQSTVCAYLPRIRPPFSFVPCSTLIKEAMCGRPILLACSYIYSTERMYHLWTLVHQVTSLETPFLSYFRRRRGELRRFSNVNMRRSWFTAALWPSHRYFPYGYLSAVPQRIDNRLTVGPPLKLVPKSDPEIQYWQLIC